MSSSQKNSLSSYELSPDEERVYYQKSQSLEGQDLPKKEKDDMLREHAANLDLLRLHRFPVKQFVLPAAYAPSISSLNTLQKITLGDLKLETHHRGCFITARTISQPYQSTQIISIIEDGSGTVAKLVLGFQDNTQPSDPSSLPLNSTVAIKEPYCKFNGPGDFVIRVDHPSDIAILRGDDPAVNMIMQYVSESKEISPEEWKTAGDKAYLDKNYPSSIECYTQAIEKAPAEDDKFKKDAYRKRAFANLTAKFFQPAKDDALASCSEASPDAKTFYCAGRAAYEIGAFEESKTLLQKALQIDPGDVKAIKEKKRAIARIREEEEGAYDFEKMVALVSEQGKIYGDHASFVKNTVVKESTGRGRGLFAAKKIAKGGLVLVEKAFCLPEKYTGDESSELVMYNFNTSSRTQRTAQPALFLGLVKTVYDNPHLAERFFGLDGGGYHRSGQEGQLIDGVPVVDTFLIEAIRLKNSFSCPRLSSALLKPSTTPQDVYLSTGLWTHVAMMNHSCLPNCSRSFIGNMMIIRATRDIEKGEELTHQYISPDAYYLTRKVAFKTHWEFECDCKLCAMEAKSPADNHEKRKELAEKIRADIVKSRGASSTTVKHVERLCKRLEELHEESVYGNLPRLLLVFPSFWLAEVWRAQKNHGKAVKHALEVIRNFGLVGEVVKGEECVLNLDNKGAVVNIEVFKALRWLAEGYRALGREELGISCEGVGRKIWETLAGCEVGVEGAF